MTTTATPEKLAIRRAAEIVGGQAALATLCGYRNRQMVWLWLNDDSRKVPIEKCPVIERATAAKGERIRREEIRPDVQWSDFRVKA